MKSNSPEIIWGWIVFVASAGAYVPLAVGGWQHPIEMNLAAYGLWAILATMFVFSLRDQGFAGWRMALGYLVGNVGMIILGLIRGGYTFNLGPAETIVFYGIVLTTCTWIVVGKVTGRWNQRILYWGGLIADILSFYPQLKQYLEPHETPTGWFIFGWFLFALGAAINMAVVERLFGKLFADTNDKCVWRTLEESAYSIENCVFIIFSIMLMLR